MKTQTKLAYAVAKAIAGSILITGTISNAEASSTYYNSVNVYTSDIITNNHGSDGWRSDEISFAGWTSSPAPFGFSNEKLHWAAEITTAGDALTISSQDAYDRYDIWADLDTAKGAWSDGAKGWEHNTDVGLFRASVDTDITIYATALQPTGSNETWTNFGISIYSGMPEGAWSAHGTWNCPNCLINNVRYAATFDSDNPLSEGGTTYLTHDATVDSSNGITFHATAGQVYTILLGGNSGGSNFSPYAGYSLNISSASPVPLPGAIWFFGSALFGWLGVMNRKRRA